MSDRAFTHPNFGKEVRVEQQGREVRLIFMAASVPAAENLVDAILTQLKGGALNLTLMGKPTSITGDV